MSSWGNNDNAANAPLWAAHSVNLRGNTTSISALFDNTTANSFLVNTSGGGQRFSNTTVGLFAIDAYEEAVSESPTAGKFAHSGWNIVTTGQGGRAGRIQTETLVALANVYGDSDGQLYPNVAITLVGPSNASVISNGSFANIAVFTVSTTLTGNTAANITYQWQYNNASGSAGWANIPANTTVIHWAGATTATLQAEPATTANNGTVLRAVVYANDEGVTAYSSNATLTVPA